MKRVIGRLKNKKIVEGVNAKNYADGNTELVKEGNKILEKKNGVWVEPFSPVANPIIEPTGGEVTTETDIVITCSTGGTIYYTTDDSSPKTSDTRVKYTEPFNIDDACTVKAVAYDGEEYSEEVYAVFTIEEVPTIDGIPDAQYDVADAVKTLLADPEDLKIHLQNKGSNSVITSSSDYFDSNGQANASSIYASRFLTVTSHDALCELFITNTLVYDEDRVYRLAVNASANSSEHSGAFTLDSYIGKKYEIVSIGSSSAAYNSGFVNWYSVKYIDLRVTTETSDNTEQ